jgi:hypothetical protein
MEFFYFRVEEFFVYGGDEMAENLVGRGFVSENGPYLHSKTLNFRLEVGQDLESRANDNSWLIDI